MLLDGVCLNSERCLGNLGYFRRDESVSCSCAGIGGTNGCQECILFADPAKADQQGCLVCKGTWFKLEPQQKFSTCVRASSCPTGTIAYQPPGPGGQCRPAFNCTAGQATSGDNGCKCADSCRICEWRADGSHFCHQCGTSRALDIPTGDCLRDTEVPPGVTMYGRKRIGIVARPAFTCTDGLDEAGLPCECTQPICGTCEWRGQNAPTYSACKKCKKPTHFFYPDMEYCRKSCKTPRTIEDVRDGDGNLVARLCLPPPS